MNLYPRSFLRLIVLGNVVAMLPLLAAVCYAALAVNDLAKRSDQNIRHAAQAATIGRALPEQLNQMERILRQYEVLRDESLLEEYATTRQEWRRNAADYAAIPLLAELAPRINELRQSEARAFAGLRTGAQGLPQLRAAIANLKRGLPPLLEDANGLLERERELFLTGADTLWQRLLAAQFIALALSVLLLGMARRTIASLWSRFERAVMVLGEGRLDRRIRLKGPDDMQRVGQRLEWLRRRMVALERERTRVMRHASHELRTPLTALREGASLLHEGIAGPLSQQQAKIASIMKTNVVRLQGLIDGLLRLQQANHAREQMETTAVRLDKLIEQTLATYQLAARDRRLRISGSLAPLTVEGSQEALTTLINNLISNAIKFSPDGGMVRITLTKEGQRAVLDVTDDGPGIAPEERERLFEPFYRGSSGKGVPGVGLGLAIAHEFVLAHNGNIEIIDRQSGAHFRTRLPLAGSAP